LPNDQLRPIQGWGSINYASFDNTSNYHSLQIQVNRRMSNNLQLGANYTWSKTLTYGSGGFGGTNIVPTIDRKLQYGLAGGDRPHNFNLNWVFQVPQPFDNAIGRHLLGGWQFSGYATFRSGAPQSVGFLQYVNGNRGQRVDFAGAVIGGGFFAGAGPFTRINVTGDPVADPTFRTQANININAFAPPSIASNGIGNAASTSVRGPGVNNFDLSLAKTIPLDVETRQLEFRWEMFNAFNHTQFSGGDYNAQFDSSGNLLNGWQSGGTFGTYTRASDARIMVLSVRVRF